MMQTTAFLENYDYHSSNRDPYPSKDWLEEHYWGQKLSTYEIAKILNCSQQKVNNALHHHGIRLRTYREVVALRNPVRFKLLELLLDGRSRKYIHLLRAVGFESGKDAGRFAYHMKILLNADLLCKSGDNYIISQKGVRVHGLVLVVDAPFLCERPKIEDVKETVGGVRFEVRFGRRNGKISCWIGCDPPGLDYQSCVFAIKHFQRIVWDQVGFRVTEFETVNCDFNEDYIGVQLDGVKSVTVRDFLGNLERIYNKGPNVVRSEVRFPAEKMTIESMLTLLKGGITPYNILQTQFALLKKIENLYEAIKFGNEVNYRILTFLKDMMEKRR